MMEAGLQFIACSLFPQYSEPGTVGADLRHLSRFQPIYSAFL